MVASFGSLPLFVIPQPLSPNSLTYNCEPGSISKKNFEVRTVTWGHEENRWRHGERVLAGLGGSGMSADGRVSHLCTGPIRRWLLEPQNEARVHPEGPGPLSRWSLRASQRSVAWTGEQGPRTQVSSVFFLYRMGPLPCPLPVTFSRDAGVSLSPSPMSPLRCPPYIWALSAWKFQFPTRPVLNYGLG